MNVPEEERSSFASGLRARFERWRREAARLWSLTSSRTVRRGAGIGGGAVLAVAVVTAVILALRPAPQTLDGFIRDWNKAVQDNDGDAYDLLVSNALATSDSAGYLRGLELLQELHREGKLVAPIEEPVDPSTSAILVLADAHTIDADHVDLALAQSDRTVALNLARAQWDRRWRIQGVSTDVATAETDASVSDSDGSGSLSEGTSEFAVAGMATTPNGTPLDTEFKLKQILEAWRAAWENEEMDAYMAWYADYATIRRVTVVDGREIRETLSKSQLRTRMERLARAYSRIQISISNVVVQGDYAEAGINFLQEFAATVDGDTRIAYQDVGLKTLKFVNDRGEWRIHDEDWRSYVNVPTYPIK